MTCRIRFDNIRAVSPDQEAFARELIEIVADQSHLDRIDQWVRGVLCDAFREDGVLPGKPPP